MACVNAMTQTQFTEQFAGIYEHSPWIAQQAWSMRPFADRETLAQAMSSVVDAADEAQRMALILAHPELAGKAAVRGELTADSRAEQQGAGLDQCTAQEYALITQLNADYRSKFGFPFIIAVKGLGRAEIIAAMRARLGNAPAIELQQAITQIKRIAELRLSNALPDDPPAVAR